jgi:dTDP-4-amino-4,6-dideoxygalactose transaminase
MYAGKGASLPETEAAAREVLSLPIYPELSSEDAEGIARRLAAALQAL